MTDDILEWYPWFHSVEKHECGCRTVGWQGKVLGRVESSLALVQLYEWVSGGAGSVRLVALADMVGWEFYESNDQMLAEYDRRWASAGRSHVACA